MPSYRDSGNGKDAGGFTLLETMVALFILVFALMAAGQYFSLAAHAASLARSKGAAAVVAESKLVYLMDLHHLDPGAADLVPGDHGPESIQVWNRPASRILNRFSVSWTVARVADPRPGKIVDALQVSVTVLPADAVGKRNLVAPMNKIVVLPAVFSPKYL